MQKLEFMEDSCEFKYDDLQDNVKNCLTVIINKLKAGQMSIMVGAGFSKNASTAYPSWTELLVPAYCIIHQKDKKASIEIENIKKEINKNPSKVAQDYIDMKGRREDLDIYIENFLLKLDRSSSLNLETHRALLDINWNDIITTNWDTLLEKANESGKYAVIKSAKDLRIRNSKRIIKINGSLREFEKEQKTYVFDDCFDYLYVITEKDFNNYHIDHPDFSNFMKVKMLQDSFCLIGFSGNDPNFKYWVKELKRTMTKGGNTKEPNYMFLIDTSKEPPDKETLEYKATSEYYRNNYIVRIGLNDIMYYLKNNESFSIDIGNGYSYTKEINEKLIEFFAYIKRKTSNIEINQVSNYKYDCVLAKLSYPFLDDSSNLDIGEYNTLPDFYFRNLYYSNDMMRNIYNILDKVNSWKEDEYLLLYNFCINNYYTVSNIYKKDFIEKLIINYQEKLLPENKSLFFVQQVLKTFRYDDRQIKYLEDFEKIDGCKNIVAYEKAVKLYYNFEYEALQKFLDDWKPEEDKNPDALTILKKIELLLALDNIKFLQYKKDELTSLFNKAEILASKNPQLSLFIKDCHRKMLWKIGYLEPNDIMNKEIDELIAKGYKLSYEYVNELLKNKQEENVKPNEDTRYSFNIFQFPDPNKTFLAVIRVFNFFEYTGIPAYLCLQESQLLELIQDNKNDEWCLCQLLLISIPFFGNSSSETLLRAIVPSILRYLSFDTIKELYDKTFKIIKYKLDKNFNPTVCIYIISEIIKRLPQNVYTDYISYFIKNVEEKNQIIISNIIAGEVWGWKKPFIEILKHINEFEDYKKILIWIMNEFLNDCDAYSKTNSNIFQSAFFSYYFQLITDDKFTNEKKEFLKSKIGKELIDKDMKYTKKLALYAYDYLDESMQKELITYFEENYTIKTDPYFITKLKTDKLKNKIINIIKEYNIMSYRSDEYRLLTFVKALNYAKLLKETDKKEICKDIMEKYKILQNNIEKLKHDPYKRYIKLKDGFFLIIAELFTKEETQKDVEVNEIYTELKKEYLKEHSEFFEFKWLYITDLTTFKVCFLKAIECFSYLRIEKRYLYIINTCLSKIVVQDSPDFEAIIERFIDIYEDKYGDGVFENEETKVILIQILNKFRKDIPFCYDDLFIKEQMKRLAKYMDKIKIKDENIEFWIKEG